MLAVCLFLVVRWCGCVSSSASLSLASICLYRSCVLARVSIHVFTLQVEHSAYK